ncbi:MAG: prohibitin family protein [Oscillospiraceae bacterium]|nr:prohibitin family protein [Ruminococcus sp.]MCD8344709.1 prohibitin family protein [Oscillospiraceae bacterium]
MQQTLSKIFNKKVIIPIIIIIIVIILLANCITVVSAGHTGVLVTLGKVNETVFQEGLHFKAPFIQEVIEIDNRITKLEVSTEAFSKDLQTVSTTLAINYRVDTNMSYSIYKNVGSDYEMVLITPAVNEVLKATVAQYTAEESVTNRTLISDGLLEGLNEKLNDSGLYITDVNIIDFDFSEAYITAIEEKQVAQQQLLKAETEKETTITNAEAEAEAMKIQAEAEAEANRILSESISDELVEYYKIEKWDGKLPTITGSSSMMLDVSSILDSSDTSSDSETTSESEAE